MISPAKQMTAVQTLVAQIRAKVIGGELVLGERLPAERVLAAQLGVSRSTVREAVRRLEQAGVVSVHKGPRGGIFVAKLNGRALTDSLGLMLQVERVPLAQLLEVRTEMECTIVRLAAERATADDLEEMRLSIAQMSDSLPSVESFQENNHRFHFAVAKASHNRVWLMLTEVTSDLVDQSLGLLQLNDAVWFRVIEYHRRILQSIVDRDADAAEEAVRSHLALLEVDLVSHLGSDLVVKANG